MRLWRKRMATSRFGWPVPRIAKVASPREISRLIDAAGFGSVRRRKGIPVQEGWRYYFLPYWPEACPVRRWKCVVVAVKEPAENGIERVQLHYSRLELTAEEFQRLPDAAAVERDQLLHFIAWDAAKYGGVMRVPEDRASLNDGD